MSYSNDTSQEEYNESGVVKSTAKTTVVNAEISKTKTVLPNFNSRSVEGSKN